MVKISVIGINGSPRKSGICARLLKKSLSKLKKLGANVKLYHLIDIEKEFYHSHYKRTLEKDFRKLGKELLMCDGVILATPVYWVNVSSLMKNFIEKLTVFEIREFKMEGKVAGFITTCEEDGGLQAILDMAGPLSHMGFLFPPYSMVFYNTKFSKKSELKWMETDIDLLGKNVYEMCSMIKSYKPDWDYEKIK